MDENYFSAIDYGSTPLDTKADLSALYDSDESYFSTPDYEPTEKLPLDEWPAPMSSLERTIALLEAQLQARSEQGQANEPEQQRASAQPSKPEQIRDDEIEM